MSNAVQPNFGISWSCVSDLTMPSVMVSGFRVVAEAVLRRWSTPRGGLIEDPTYGYDLTNAIGEDIDAQTLASMSQGAATEAEKDPRVRACFVTLGLINSVLTVQARIETAEGPFTLVAAVSGITVTLLQVQAAA